MKSAFSFDIETHVESGADLRRFRWRLKASGEGEVASAQTFATKREAVKEGEIALQRAMMRGRLRP